MPQYTLHLYRIDGTGITFEVLELPNDAAAFARAGVLLDEHLSCDRVVVWDGNRSVVARHREQPVIRPVARTA